MATPRRAAGAGAASLATGLQLPVPASGVRGELRAAIRQLSARSLKTSVKWLAQLLAALPAEEAKKPVDSAYLREQDSEPTDQYLLAKAYFDGGEFLRASHAVRQPTDHLDLFIWAYSLFMAGEREKEQQLAEGANQLQQNPGVANPYLRTLQADLSKRAADDTLDGFGWYIFAVVLRELKQRREATDAMLQAVHMVPLNWSAWMDLAALVESKELLEQLPLPAHWITHLFLTHFYTSMLSLELASHHATLALGWFPTSGYLKGIQGQILYNKRQFDAAQAAWERVFTDDPYRLEGIDMYSNVLYIKELRPELSVLAQKAVKVDKYRPESCCVVGNYYSLRGYHEKAVISFQRALRVDRNYTSAWTLMGHEYVELKNSHAAIQAYRRAVDGNPRDFRAWYGLGQTYEILRLFMYAIHYYQRATLLRPYDSRMWCALGGCYEKTDRKQDAIKCYERADAHDDQEGSAALVLARLYKSVDPSVAYQYYRKHLTAQDRTGTAQGAETSEALVFMAIHARNCGRLGEAEELATRGVALPNSAHAIEFKAVLREIRSLRGESSATSAFRLVNTSLTPTSATAGTPNQSNGSIVSLDLSSIASPEAAPPRGGGGGAAAGAATPALDESLAMSIDTEGDD